MAFTPAPWWSRAPFLRLLPPFTSGILLNEFFSVNLDWIISICTIALIGLVYFSRLKTKWQFSYSFINGVWLNLLLISFGMWNHQQKDIRFSSNWFGHSYKPGDTLFALIKQPLGEKTRTFKSILEIKGIIRSGSLLFAKGKLIVYFEKVDKNQLPAFSEEIIFSSPLHPIQSTRNPGAFDYRRYCAFNQIHHQVYLKKSHFIKTGKNDKGFLSNFLFKTHEWVINTIRQNIPDKKSAGLAEALLIGYKDDLDKDLVQAYTNTGVVHVIAISGLHIGIIYWVISLLLKPVKKFNKIKWINPILLLGSLWLFTLLAGAGPSVLRSAVMFSFIVIGENISRRSSVHNSLASSAFLLLAFDPFTLFDVGFQLSYAAVLSIVVLYNPIYQLFYCKNRLLDSVWKLIAVTLSAQIFTLPLCLYHFHQFPNLFLITNLVAVPLSSLILFAELLLCAVAFFIPVANAIGYLLTILIKSLNGFIEYMEEFRFATWDGININIIQVVLLYILIVSLYAWIMNRNQFARLMGVFALFMFVTIRTYSFLLASKQQLIIVYNIPRHSATDFIYGRKSVFRGDPQLLIDEKLQNFHLKPSRVKYRVEQVDSNTSVRMMKNYTIMDSLLVVNIDKKAKLSPGTSLISPDLLIISHSPGIQPDSLLKHMPARQLVADASNTIYSVAKWRAAAARLGIPFHSTAESGAFVMKCR